MITIEEDIESADWIKQAWDLPPYKSPEFMETFGHDLPHFRTLPVYRYAVEQGTIVNDEWAGKVKKFNPHHDERGRFTTSDNATESNDEFAYLKDKNRSPIEGMSPHMNAISALSIVAQLKNVAKDEPIDSLVGKIIEAVEGNAPRLSFVHKHGKVMEVEGTDDLRTPQRCYNNSVDVMLDSMRDNWGIGKPRVDYVEGILTEHGVPLAHAWNRVGDHMVDHTVKDPWNHEYMGVVIPRTVVMGIMTTNAFGKSRGEGVLGTLVLMKDKKKRDRYIKLIMEANQ